MRVERSSNLRGIAQAQHAFWRQFELVQDLMPNWHESHCARILKAEVAATHSPFEKSDHFFSYLRDARLRPPRHRQGEVVKAPEIVTVEEAENAVVKLDDLPALPVALVVAAVDTDLVDHIDPQRAQDMRAQRGAAPMHAEHENDWPTLYLRRDRRDPVAPRRLERERLWTQHVIHCVMVI